MNEFLKRYSSTISTIIFGGWVILIFSRIIIPPGLQYIKYHSILFIPSIIFTIFASIDFPHLIYRFLKTKSSVLVRILLEVFAILGGIAIFMVGMWVSILAGFQP